MQASTQTQTKTEVVTVPDAPGAPAAPAGPVSITITDATGKAQTIAVPQTRNDILELQRQREELASQLNSVSDRRRQLSEEIRNAPEGASRTGLEGRLAVLDQRILNLENDLAITGQQLAAASSGLVGSAYVQPSGGDDFEEGVLAGGFSVLATLPLLYIFLRRRWKKKMRTEPVQDMPLESARRLERLEHGMESIAIEIERVSEGQRFVTRLLSEGQGPIGTRRIPEPVPASTTSDS